MNTLGGKIDKTDKDIYETMAREFNEESKFISKSFIEKYENNLRFKKSIDRRYAWVKHAKYALAIDKFNNILDNNKEEMNNFISKFNTKIKNLLDKYDIKLIGDDLKDSQQIYDKYKPKDKESPKYLEIIALHWIDLNDLILKLLPFVCSLKQKEFSDFNGLDKIISKVYKKNENIKVKTKEGIEFSLGMYAKSMFSLPEIFNYLIFISSN